MESLHKTESRPWISPLINVKKFRDDWCSNLPVSKGSNSKEVFKLNARDYSNLETECGLAAMKCPVQHTLEISKELVIPENVDLETLRLQKEDLDRRREDSQYEAMMYVTSKFYNYPPHKIAGYDVETPDDLPYVQVKEPEVLLCVQVFRPEKKNHKYLKSNQARLPIFQIDQEFMVLGCQYLTQLRDKIDCVSDRAIPGDYSEHPDLPAEMTCKDLYKSGFFYINGKFYNDMRHPDCRDYSEVIINWSNNTNRGIGPFRKALMEDAKFIDLDIQLGYPYVYVHQGYCEHLIVFSDLSMYTHHHIGNKNDYPVYVALKPKKRAFCMICHMHTAEWIVFDNKRVPENPLFFCKKCFFSYNYTENNEKIGSFRAYHHIDRSSIL